MAYNIKKFADRMAEKGNITKAQAKREVKLFLDTLADCMGDGETVKFLRFGRFEVKIMKEMKARVPRTGKNVLSQNIKR